MPIDDSDLLEGLETEIVAPVIPVVSPIIDDSDLLEGFEEVSEPVPKITKLSLIHI